MAKKKARVRDDSGQLAEEQARLAAEIRSVRDSARLEPRERAAAEVLPAPLEPRTPSAVPQEPLPPRSQSPAPPDGAAVNTLWETRAAGPRPRGVRGFFQRALERLMAPRLDAQVAFNSRQVQLDNEILVYIDEHVRATHRHYDGILGIHGRHMEEIDTRHLILQEELVAHVHDLVRRIDLVLGEGERGRLSLESSLRELRLRLAAIEERLKI